MWLLLIYTIFFIFSVRTSLSLFQEEGRCREIWEERRKQKQRLDYLGLSYIITISALLSYAFVQSVIIYTMVKYKTCLIFVVLSIAELIMNVEIYFSEIVPACFDPDFYYFNRIKSICCWSLEFCYIVFAIILQIC